MAESDGWRDVFKLSRDWLSVQEVVDAVSSSSCGAISVFIGTTREDEVDGRKVIGLEYEAYELMVQSEFSKLCADIRERWPTVTHICVHHRLGLVGDELLVAWKVDEIRRQQQEALTESCSQVGQASVVMAISSPHRHDGQQAIQHCISQLKANIPIWKKEVYDTQDSSWKENAECSWAIHDKPHPITSSAENM